MCRFLPAPSARRATNQGHQPHHGRQHFYPRPPRGGRPAQHQHSRHRSGFLSTPSARRATSRRFCAAPQTPISIHALREEGDASSSLHGSTANHFYPRPPRGGRLRRGPFRFLQKAISVHALREEGDRLCSAVYHASEISIHTLREEGDIPGAAF